MTEASTIKNRTYTVVSQADVRRTTKLANFVCQLNRPTKICRLSCKNRPNLSATKIVRFYCPSRTRSILDEKIARLPRMPSCDWPTVCLHDKPVISDPRSWYVQSHAEIHWPVNFKNKCTTVYLEFSEESSASCPLDHHEQHLITHLADDLHHLQQH